MWSWKIYMHSNWLCCWWVWVSVVRITVVLLYFYLFYVIVVGVSLRGLWDNCEKRALMNVSTSFPCLVFKVALTEGEQTFVLLSDSYLSCFVFFVVFLNSFSESACNFSFLHLQSRETHPHPPPSIPTTKHFVPLFGCMHQSNVSPMTIATRIPDQVALLLFMGSRRRLQCFPLPENHGLFWPCYQFCDRPW